MKLLLHLIQFRLKAFQLLAQSSILLIVDSGKILLSFKSTMICCLSHSSNRARFLLNCYHFIDNTTVRHLKTDAPVVKLDHRLTQINPFNRRNFESFYCVWFSHKIDFISSVQFDARAINRSLMITANIQFLFSIGIGNLYNFKLCNREKFYNGIILFFSSEMRLTIF